MVDQVLSANNTGNSWSGLAAFGVALVAAVVAFCVYYWNSVVVAAATAPPLSEEELRQRRFERLQQQATAAAADATSNGNNTKTNNSNKGEKKNDRPAASKSSSSATTTNETSKHPARPEQDPKGNKDPTIFGAPGISASAADAEGLLSEAERHLWHINDEAASPQLVNEPEKSSQAAVAAAESPGSAQKQTTTNRTEHISFSTPNLLEKEESSRSDTPSSTVSPVAETPSPVLPQDHSHKKKDEEPSSVSAEGKGPVTTDIAHSSASSSTKKKKSPRRLKRKPSAVLHKALCQITGVPIPKEEILDAGDCWDSLRDSFMPVFLTMSRQFSTVSVRSTAQWYNRVRDVVSDSDADDKLPLSECLNLLGAHLVHRVATAVVESSSIAEGAANDLDLGDDDDDDDGLFGNEYSNNDTVAAPVVVPDTKSNSNALAEFLELLEPVETLVSRQFLEAVITVQPVALPGILLRAALRRIPSIDHCRKGLTRDEILKKLTCLTNLVVLSSAVAQELWTLLDREIRGGNDDQSEATGRTMEEQSVLGKLLPVAALVIPNAGQEAAPRQASTPTSSSRSLSYVQRTLRDVDNYPIVAFEPRTSSNSKKLDLALTDLQRTVTLARESCTTILKRVMKAGAQRSNKETRQSLFRWLGAVVKLK